MSNPTLRLNICADLKLSDIAEFLGLDFDKSSAGEGVAFNVVEQPIGQIIVGFREFESILNFAPFKHEWNITLSFRCPSSWNEIRMALVIALTETIQYDHPGAYLAWLDTGEVLFYVADDFVKYNKDAESRFEFVLAHKFLKLKWSLEPLRFLR